MRVMAHTGGGAERSGQAIDASAPRASWGRLR